MNKYSNLFEPITIGTLEIKNRYSMAPIGPFGFTEDNGAFNQRGIDYYVERARGGAGLIITGLCSVENQIEEISRPSIPCPTANPAAFLLRGQELTERIHDYDCKILLQLTAGFGRVGNPGFIKKAVAPSAIDNRWSPGVKHRELTIDEIRRYIQRFATAAAIGKKAGFDGVEIHAVHEGYLLDQFAIGLFNKRVDEYGGDLKGRLKFAIEIVQAIKATCGKAFPVSLRYSLKSFVKGIRQGALPGEDFQELGRDIDEGLEAARILVQAGYDILNVDAGTYDSWYWNHPPMYFGEGGMYLPFGKMIKEVVDIPVIVAGRMDDPDLASRAIRDGSCDIIGLGRPLLADPYLPNKVKSGRVERIRPCLSCHQACMGRIGTGGSISCAVNPACGREEAYGLRPAVIKKKVLVIGGGIAGMESARVCALRGHEVFLYEKTDRLGGHLIPGGVPPFKKDDLALIKWYELELKELKIIPYFNIEVDTRLINAVKPDVVVVATGSSPIMLDLPGANRNNIMTADKALLEPSQVGSQVVIIGAGLIGAETGLWLKQLGKEVTLVESSPEILGGQHALPFANYDMLKDLLVYHQVNVMTSAVVTEVTEDSVVVKTEAGEKQIAADTVILAVGYTANNTLYAELKNVIDDIYLVGDAKTVKNIMWAIWNAYEIARQI